jgi:hypothetical protein
MFDRGFHIPHEDRIKLKNDDFHICRLESKKFMITDTTQSLPRVDSFRNDGVINILDCLLA